MNILEKTKIPFEILVATTNRTTLDFIFIMFKNNILENYQILIINQTSKENLLYSKFKNIRVINSFEKGLSKSRNLALKNALGYICLLADDDVVYLEGFDKLILDSYNRLPEANLISFKTLTTDKKPFSVYPKEAIKLKSFYKKVLSIEISFKKEFLVQNKVQFDEDFGLGSVFQDGENRLFLNEIMMHHNSKVFFVPEFIVIHKPFSSSDDVASDRYFFARTALFYKTYGIFAWLLVCKLIFSLVRRKYIKLNEVSHKLKVANQSISTYKKLVNG